MTSRYVLAIDVGHSTGLALGRIDFLKGAVGVQCITSFTTMQGGNDFVTDNAYQLFKWVDEIYVEYPVPNSFSSYARKTKSMMDSWRAVLFSVGMLRESWQSPIREILPGTWKNSKVRKLNIRKITQKEGFYPITGHEKDAWGIIFWRAFQIEQKGLS